MSPWWSPALAALLHLLPMQSQPEPLVAADAADSNAALAVELAGARSAWARALDAAVWDRDTPEAVAAADALGARLLPWLPGNGTPPADRGLVAEADLLLRDVVPRSLGEALRAQSNPDRGWVAVYLSRHDDPALLAALAGTGSGVTAAEATLALADLAFEHHRGATAPFLIAAARDGGDRDAICRGALALPDPARREVAESILALVPEDRPDAVEIPCLVLFASTPTGSARLATWITRSAPGITARTAPRDLVRGLITALALVGTRHDAVAVRAARRILALPDAALIAHATIAPYVAQLGLEAPAARSLLAAFDRSLPIPLWDFGLTRMRGRDPAVFADAERWIPSLRTQPDSARIAGALLGLGPSMDVLTRERRLALLRTASDRARADGNVPDAEQFAAWADALEVVAHCGHARSCLIALLARGSDASAARAVTTLGAAGLATLSRDEALQLIRRLVVRPDVWTVAAVALTLRGCPRNLRGVREVRAAGLREGPSVAVHAYLREFERACAR